MRIPDLLTPERIVCQCDCSSKKRSLELISRLLADALPEFTDGEIFNSLIGRERLGSTGLGKGVALPHGRLEGFKHEPIAAMLTLSEGVDFDAIDGEPVHTLFALLVPEASTDEHLQILARLAEMFNNDEFAAGLRSCMSSEQCYQLIVDWDSRHPLTA